MVGKYLETFHQGVGESTALLKANWKMSLATSLKSVVDGKERVSHVSRS